MCNFVLMFENLWQAPKITDPTTCPNHDTSDRYPFSGAVDKNRCATTHQCNNKNTTRGSLELLAGHCVRTKQTTCKTRQLLIARTYRKRRFEALRSRAQELPHNAHSKTTVLNGAGQGSLRTAAPILVTLPLHG